MGGSPECPVIARKEPQWVNHYTGGTDAANALFYDWVHKRGTEASCFGGCDDFDGIKCAIEVYTFSTRDRMTNMVRYFLLNENVAGTVDTFNVMAALVPSV